MSFQAYLDNIQTITGVSPDQFLALAKEKGFMDPSVKAGTVITWLKEDYSLGHGHCMAIFKLIKDNR